MDGKSTTMTTSSSESEDWSLRTRLELYGVYENEDSLHAALKEYCIETTPADETTAAPRRNFSVDYYLDDSTPSQPGSNGMVDTQQVPSNPNSIMATRQQTSSDRDIWDKFPLKEPKDPIVCPACGRTINTIRFALHLDKCMGIGTTVRSATGGAGGSFTRSSAHTHK